ncbi:MAG: Crp/Fnr family transcriptional regulator [Chloroflexi bacterium]|nr:Crp/Fnr family transcriptional regulator [Chloroflexota bacterium]
MNLDLVKNNKYFAGLSLDQLGALNKYFFEQEIKRGEIILREGEPSGALYFVIHGIVKLYKTSAEGKDQIIYIAGPGESFNDAAVMDGGSNMASAQTLEPVLLFGIRKHELDDILKNYPQVSLNAINVIASQERQLVSVIEDLSFKHVIGRVANILMKYAGDGVGPKTRLTQQEMAAMAGTVREVVGRSLKMLEADGIIRVDRNHIVISNKKALQNMVEMQS